MIDEAPVDVVVDEVLAVLFDSYGDGLTPAEFGAALWVLFQTAGEAVFELVTVNTGREVAEVIALTDEASDQLVLAVHGALNWKREKNR